MAVKLISLWVFLLQLNHVKPDLANGGLLLTRLTEGFSAERKNMSLDGVAVIDDRGILQLTNQSVQAVGYAFYKYPIQFKNSSGKVMSFSTAFAFAITHEHGKQGDHGLNFTISPTIDSGRNGNNSHHGLALEFDTVLHSKYGGIDDNHVDEIDLNIIVSNKFVRVQHHMPSHTRKEYLNLKSDSGWSFNINGDAQDLCLDKLPKLLTVTERRKNYTVLIVIVSVSSALVAILITAFTFYIIKKIKKAHVIEACEFDIGPHRYSDKELYKATKGFGDKELLGFGGFGRVYKGTLPNSDTQVAVKRVSHDSKQGLKEFVSEVASSGRLRHRNLVQLLGWCRRKADLLLVYEFMPNGSLDKYLFDEPKAILSWEQRFKIIKGVASGLLYLHEECEQTVVHRDIKAGNVLLDSEFNGRLSDFGLAKLYARGSNPSTTKVVGTLGYLAPELTRTGKPTTSSDVFAFGALLLEVVCGRRPIDVKALPEELMLVEWVWEKWSVGAILEVIDPRLDGDFDEVEAVLVLKLGLLCSSNAPEARPSMRHVVRYLEMELALEVDVGHVAVPNSNKGGGGAGHVVESDHLIPSFSIFSKERR
uniref:non-specific serine/threonine protein kinase n=1 Tax=Fagus sylvatica TaxID=28930 RepID=A0A2N9IFI1_FAGSY